jgi:tetratricopeptide (TPR) repeat protein
VPASHALRPALSAMRVSALVTLGRDAEAPGLLDRLLASDPPPAQRALLATCAARRATMAGRLDEARAWGAEARAAAEAAGDAHALMRACQNEGVAAWAVGDHAAAEAHLERTLALAEQHDAPKMRARAQHLLGVMRQQRDDPAAAIALMGAAHAYFTAIGDRFETAYCERSMSYVARDLGDHERQLAWATSSWATFTVIGRGLEAAATAIALGLAHEDRGEIHLAARAYARVVRVALRRRQTPLLLRGLAGLATTLKPIDRDEALSLLACVDAHPATREPHRDDLRQRRGRLAPTPTESARADSAACGLDIDTLAARWLLQVPDAE